MEQTNPYHLPDDIAHRLASLAAYAAMGIPMTPKWNGRYKESYLQIQFKGRQKTIASINFGNLHVLYLTCRFDLCMCIIKQLFKFLLAMVVCMAVNCQIMVVIVCMHYRVSMGRSIMGMGKGVWMLM